MSPLSSPSNNYSTVKKELNALGIYGEEMFIQIVQLDNSFCCPGFTDLHLSQRFFNWRLLKATSACKKKSLEKIRYCRTRFKEFLPYALRDANVEKYNTSLILHSVYKQYTWQMGYHCAIEERNKWISEKSWHLISERRNLDAALSNCSLSILKASQLPWRPSSKLHELSRKTDGVWPHLQTSTEGQECRYCQQTHRGGVRQGSQNHFPWLLWTKTNMNPLSKGLLPIVWYEHSQGVAMISEWYMFWSLRGRAVPLLEVECFRYEPQRYLETKPAEH